MVLAVVKSKEELFVVGLLYCLLAVRIDTGDARGRNGMNFHRNASPFLLFLSASNNQSLLFLATRKKGFLAVYCNESHLEANFEFLSLFLLD